MISLPRHRDARAVIIGSSLALVGWIGAFSRAIPIRAVRQPGLEMALLLRVTYSSSIRGLRVSELAVFFANMIFWSSVLVVGLGLRRAFRRACEARAWLVCAALLAAPLVLLSALLSHYFGGFLSELWWVTYPGWALKRLVPGLPEMSFVMDMPALLGELMYPTRLIHFIVAELLAIAIWTLAIWVAILARRGFTTRQNRANMRVA